MLYITPFRRDTLQATAPSTDSGFKTLADAKAAMGVEPVRASGRCAVFHLGPNEGIFFSFYQVRIEPVKQDK